MMDDQELIFFEEATLQGGPVQWKLRKELVFEKRFRQAVGTTPKRYANIVRFKNLIGGSHSGENLTEIGLNAGYFDQSHFIRDFKTYTGRVPSEFF